MPEGPPRSPRSEALKTLEGVERGEAIKAKVDAATSFEELYAVLREVGSVPGGHRVYAAEELIGKIEEVRKVGLALNLINGLITGTYGLREKIDNLIAAEQGAERE